MLIDAGVTEEGQRVAWDGWAWQRRELTKRLAPTTPWPSEAQLPSLFDRYGLAGAAAKAPIRVPARICADVYLVASWPSHCYAVDCGSEGIAVIDPGLTSNYTAVMDNIAALGLPGGTVRWVAASRWDVLLPGHGTLSLDNARLDVEKARHVVRRHLSEGKPIPALLFADPEYRGRMYGRARSACTAPA